MELVWDEAKRRVNLAKHGIDFRDLGALFSDPDRVEVEDERQDYGELRLVLLGSVQGRLLHVTYTPRGNSCRIISARRANQREQRFYERTRAAHQGDRDP